MCHGDSPYYYSAYTRLALILLNNNQEPACVRPKFDQDRPKKKPASPRATNWAATNAFPNRRPPLTGENGCHG
jgi:hypothetical protein